MNENTYGPPHAGVAHAVERVGPVHYDESYESEYEICREVGRALYDRHALGLDASACLRNVMTLLYDANDWDGLRTLERAFGVGPFELGDRAPDARSAHQNAQSPDGTGEIRLRSVG